MKINLEVKQNTDYDVIVAGGGPAGCAAAAAAARDGAKTLIIESMGCLGGMGTAGLVPSWCPFSDHVRIIYKGIGEKVFDRTKAQMDHIKPEDWDWVPIDNEALKRVYDDLMEEYGVDVLFYTTLSHVETDGQGNVDHILVTNKSGISSYKAKIYIDCTGDGDLAVWAGAEYEQGGEQGELQPATSCFVLSNVDDYSYAATTRLHANWKQSPIYDICKDEEFPLLDDTHACNSSIGPATVGFNAGHLWGVDNTDVHTVSKAMVRGRRQTKEFRDALAKYDPKAFANAHIAATAQLMGIRETRRIIGDYYLTIEDFLNRRTFEDEIARNCYYIDIHNTKEEVAKKFDKDFDSDKRYERYKDGESHGIPYGCLVPKGLNNVLMAGRMISTDRIVQGSTRVMPVCFVMGEAAGIAAVMAKDSQDVRKVDVQKLRTKMREYDNYLP